MLLLSVGSIFVLLSLIFYLMKKVSIVIVTWNNEKDIEECLTSVLAQSYEHIEEIVVVDNNSSDNSVEIVKSKFQDKVTLIESVENTYFTGGNNKGIFYAMKKDIDYIAILNPDTKVESDWLEKLIEVAEKDGNIGIVGSKVLFYKNANEGKINSAGMIYDGFIQGYDRGYGEVDTGQYNSIEEVPAITGTSMLLSSKMIKEIGGFWEDLKMYVEDVELCIRAKKAGWKIMYSPFSIVHHKYMQSTDQNKMLKVQDWKAQNWVKIALRHYPLLRKLSVIKKYYAYKMFGISFN